MGWGNPNVKVGGLGRIHPQQTPACRKRRLMEGKVELSATKPTPPSVLSDEEGLLVTLQDEKQDLSKGGLSAHLATLCVNIEGFYFVRFIVYYIFRCLKNRYILMCELFVIYHLYHYTTHYLYFTR